MHPFTLTNRVFLVTGSARGLGFEIAKALVNAGAVVAVNGRDAQAVASAVREINISCDSNPAAGHAREAAFDVTNNTLACISLENLCSMFGRFDGLINCVGQRARQPLESFGAAQLEQYFQANLIAPFQLCQQAAALMKPQRAGRIINLTSIAGHIARNGDAAYTTAKGAITALTRSLAAELGAHGITVNAIAPGYFATEANAQWVQDESINRWLDQRTSLGRWGHPTEVAGAAVFLASDAASYITGHVLAVDGGYLSHF